MKKYPYNCSKQEDDIKSNSKSMLDKITEESNNKLEEYGITVDSVQITEAVYAPEIAHSMLMKQQAKATVDARTEIVNGAVGIIQDTLDKFPNLSTETKNKLTINLLTTISSNNTQPVVNLE